MGKVLNKEEAIAIINAILLDSQKSSEDWEEESLEKLSLLHFSLNDKRAFTMFLNLEKTDIFEMLDTGEDESTLRMRLDNRESEYESNYCVFKFLGLCWKLEYDFLSHSGADPESLRISIVQPKTKTVIYYE